MGNIIDIRNIVKINSMGNIKRILCILCFLLIVTLFFVPVGAEVVATIEVNESIQIGDYYKNRTILENGWNLSVNITTNSPVDVFVLSKKDFIDYEVNGVVSPPHTEWYSLNTTSFQKNLNVSQKGDYFVVVDNSVVPVNGAMPIGSVNVDGSIEVENNRAPSIPNSFKCAFLIPHSAVNHNCANIFYTWPYWKQ